MSSSWSNDLLEPSLNRSRSAEPPLSRRATFMISFFGGAMAAALVAAWNARKLQRPPSDVWIAALSGCVALAISGFLLTLQATGNLPEWMTALGPARRVPRTIDQVIAVAIWALFGWLQQDERRAAELGGQEAKNAWKVGLTMIAIAGVVYTVLFLGIRNA